MMSDHLSPEGEDAARLRDKVKRPEDLELGV